MWHSNDMSQHTPEADFVTLSKFKKKVPSGQVMSPPHPHLYSVTHSGLRTMSPQRMLARLFFFFFFFFKEKDGKLIHGKRTAFSILLLWSFLTHVRRLHDLGPAHKVGVPAHARPAPGRGRGRGGGGGGHEEEEEEEEEGPHFFFFERQLWCEEETRLGGVIVGFFLGFFL